MAGKSYVPSYYIKPNGRPSYESKTTKSSLKDPLHKTRRNKLTNPEFFYDSYTKSVHNINNPQDRLAIYKTLKKNITKKRRVNTSKVILPKQSKSNCWFNVLFITYFVSEKGRMFTKPLRLDIINNKFSDVTNKQKHTKELNHALFMLNIAIDACLSGSFLSQTLDTNDIITAVYENIDAADKSWCHKCGDFGNSLAYYTGIMEYLYRDDDYPISAMYKMNFDFKQNVEVQTALPHIYIIRIMDDDSKKISKKKNEIDIISSLNNQTGTYRLDSICIRDTRKEHVGCLFTLNKQGFFFDGDANKRHIPMNWKNNKFLNSKREFAVDRKSAHFSLRNGYQILYYYRVK